MWLGFASVDVGVPSPKFQTRASTAPVEVSAKATVSGAVPEVGVAVKDAVGAGSVGGGAGCAGAMHSPLHSIRSSTSDPARPPESVTSAEIRCLPGEREAANGVPRPSSPSRFELQITLAERSPSSSSEANAVKTGKLPSNLDRFAGAVITSVGAVLGAGAAGATVMGTEADAARPPESEVRVPRPRRECWRLAPSIAS